MRSQANRQPYLYNESTILILFECFRRFHLKMMVKFYILSVMFFCLPHLP